MKGFFARAAQGLISGAGLAGMIGCGAYYHYVDPCWPERYNLQARQATHEPFDIQAANGRALEQTVWNWQFEPGTDKLNEAGLARLNYISRRRPGPDCRVYVQTAHDVAFLAEPEKGATARSELDQRRVNTVHRYLAAVNAGRTNAATFDIAVHDPSDPTLPADMAHGSSRVLNVTGAYIKLENNFQGAVQAGGGGAGGGGGAAGAAGGGGGGGAAGGGASSGSGTGR